jgi:hypothetical protein
MQLDRPLVQIRVRGMLEQFDLALAVIRRRPLALGATALAGIAPFAALNAALLPLAGPSRLPLWPLLIVLEAQLATAPLTVVLGGLMFGERPGVRRVLADLGRSFVPLVLFAGLLRGLAFVSVLLLPVVADRLLFLDEVILLEGARPGEVWRRAGALGEGLGGQALARMIGQVMLALLLMVAAWWGASKAAEMLLDRMTFSMPVGPVAELAPQVAAWGAAAFFGVARFLGYIDQRIRQEGWDVELRLRAAGRALEDATRW